MKNLLAFICFIILLHSCASRNDNQKDNQSHPSVETDNAAAIHLPLKDEKPNIFKDTLVFDSYDDNGDYMLLNAKKGNDFYGFINNDEDRSLLRGDIFEIHWKKDTVSIAGDGATTEMANWLVFIKKIKDGNVSKFRKEYKKLLKYHWHEEYSQSYLDEIYLLAEYYIANSKNELINQAIKDKSQIEYSIEKSTKNNKDYEVLGIGYMFEHRFVIMQWIYVERETKQIYEYDLANDRLIAFIQTHLK